MTMWPMIVQTHQTERRTTSSLFGLRLYVLIRRSGLRRLLNHSAHIVGLNSMVNNATINLRNFFFLAKFVNYINDKTFTDFT